VAPPPSNAAGRRPSAERILMVWSIVGGIIYFVLLVTLGVLSIRKGHWVMFLVGLIIPIFWFIGALLPRRRS
jgi:lipopolysaccharide export LptBFGC system permease protein LptF